MARTHTQDMTKGNPYKLLLTFSVPMLIGNLFQQFYNMVDTIIVGRYVGANALGAVGATGGISFLFFSLSFGLAAGIGIIVSQFFGAGDTQRVKKAVSTSAYIMIMSAIIMGTIGILSARSIMEFLKTPSEMIDDATTYLVVTCGGLIAVALYNGVAAVLRALGDSKTPLIFLVIACIINIVLDLLFVIQFNMGVLGVALATVIAQFIAGVGCMAYAWFTVPVFRMPLREYVPDKHIFKKCMIIGIPVALQNAMISVSCIALQFVVNSYGATIVAAFTAQTRVEQLVQQPFNSLGAALATYTGQNIGAGKIERVQKGFWAATIISTVFALGMIPVSWLGAEAIMRLFTDDLSVIAEGARGIKIVSLFFAPLGMIYVTRNVLNGAGDANFAMLSGLVEVVGRVGFAKPLSMISSIGVLSIWLTTGLTWLITGVISCIRYGQGKWKYKGIVEPKKPMEESQCS